MVYKKELSIKQRIASLTSLLSDSKSLGFNPDLVSKYESQLVSLLIEVVKEKNKLLVLSR